MSIPNNYPNEFAGNLLVALFTLTASDWRNPKFHAEADAFLKSETAYCISNGLNLVILEKLEKGWSAGNKTAYRSERPEHIARREKRHAKNCTTETTP